MTRVRFSASGYSWVGWRAVSPIPPNQLELMAAYRGGYSTAQPPAITAVQQILLNLLKARAYLRMLLTCIWPAPKIRDRLFVR